MPSFLDPSRGPRTSLGGPVGYNFQPSGAGTMPPGLTGLKQWTESVRPRTLSETAATKRRLSRSMLNLTEHEVKRLRAKQGERSKRREEVGVARKTESKNNKKMKKRKRKEGTSGQTGDSVLSGEVANGGGEERGRGRGTGRGRGRGRGRETSIKGKTAVERLANELSGSDSGLVRLYMEAVQEGESGCVRG